MSKKSPADDLLAALELSQRRAKYAFYAKASPELKAILDDIKQRCLAGQISYSDHALVGTLREMYGLKCDRTTFRRWLRDTDDGKSR